MSDQEITTLKVTPITSTEEMPLQDMPKGNKEMDFFIPDIQSNPKENAIAMIKWFKKKGRRSDLSIDECAANMNIFHKVYIPAVKLDLKHNLSEKDSFEFVNFTEDLKNFKESKGCPAKKET